MNRMSATRASAGISVEKSHACSDERNGQRQPQEMDERGVDDLVEHSPSTYVVRIGSQERPRVEQRGPQLILRFSGVCEVGLRGGIRGVNLERTSVPSFALGPVPVRELNVAGADVAHGQVGVELDCGSRRPQRLVSPSAPPGEDLGQDDVTDREPGRRLDGRAGMPLRLVLAPEAVARQCGEQVATVPVRRDGDQALGRVEGCFGVGGKLCPRQDLE